MYGIKKKIKKRPADIKTNGKLRFSISFFITIQSRRTEETHYLYYIPNGHTGFIGVSTRYALTLINLYTRIRTFIHVLHSQWVYHTCIECLYYYIFYCR